PKFKLIIAGNHKPAIKNPDEAMRARLNMVPCTVTIPKAKRDKKLPEKLEAEWPAILRWMIDGCLKWQERGLEQPKAVIDATAEYFREQDTFRRWLEECCIKDPGLQIGSTLLFENWKAFAQRGNVDPKNIMWMSDRLREIDGIEHKRSSGSNGWRGIGLKADPSQHAQRYEPGEAGAEPDEIEGCSDPGPEDLGF
ncbi:MAG: hypothetical protein INR71_16415, partial [Terriglobus roseus]|nr:hypothetical protein [Terriglobus roseus]